MGQSYTAFVSEPHNHPDKYSPPTFDPMLGFPSGRKERVMVATNEEMEAAKLTLEERDYCAHVLLDFRKCRSENWPWVANCKHEKHAYLTCEYDDYVLRMKEFERERRLKTRKNRIEARNHAVELSE